MPRTIARHFVSRGLPVLEGKHLDPFAARVMDATQFIDRRDRRAPARRQSPDRLAASRRTAKSPRRRTCRTLIAAVLPAGVVTTHTIFCLRHPADESLQWFLCGIFNSFVANYLVRLRGGTHLPAATIHQLPVPMLPRSGDTFGTIASLARSAGGRRMRHVRKSRRGAPRLQDRHRRLRARAAHVPAGAGAERQAAFEAFERMEDAI